MTLWRGQGQIWRLPLLWSGLGARADCFECGNKPLLLIQSRDYADYLSRNNFSRTTLHHAVIFNCLVPLNSKRVLLWKFNVAEKQKCLGHVKCPTFLLSFKQILFPPQIFVSQISIFTEFLPVEAALIRVDRRTDRHEEANWHFSRLCESA